MFLCYISMQIVVIVSKYGNAWWRELPITLVQVPACLLLRSGASRLSSPNLLRCILQLCIALMAGWTQLRSELGRSHGWLCALQG